MKTLQTTTFLRAAKKLHRNQVPALKEAVKLIQQNPLIGEMKKGDLPVSVFTSFIFCTN